MSPASQGGLELKRYIGSCLISAPALRKTGGGCRGAAAAEGGAALVAGPAPAPLCGLPLISLAARPGAFSRLAMHTQGAPLILAGRYGARKQGQGQGQRQQQQPQQRGQGAAQPQTAARRRAPALAPAVARAAEGATEAAAAGGAGGGRATSSDSLNTASDESSGPSENSLPRIIKPRKRRKKDRKPPPAPAASQPAAPPSPEAAAPEGSSIVTLRPYVPLCFELYDGARPPPAAATATATASTRRAAEPKRSEPPRSKPRPQLQLQAQAARSGDGEAAPQLQLRPPAPSASPSPSVCQCRYCDPRGHIWDVHRHCYSPVLTAPAPDESPFASIPLFLSAPPAGHAADTDDGFFSDDLPTSASPFSLSGDAEDSPADGGSGSALRRSWSGCSSSSSSSFSSSSSSSSSPPSLAADPGGRAHTAAVTVASQGLQVSTEIVTSPNGHRDLEIRFYSSSPPGRQAASDARVRTEAAWPASRPGGGGLWRSGQADEHGAAALGDEVLQLSIRAEE
ncbi:trinucleotide repeat-containing gene 18 protein-like [Schistocerca gregaria]|uniref:trinucleotide repeat-containing gene 18 protein-like n=1 Tax=Schistocerca gregaria TaxID=7010 RepID=UPI00211F0352|nr:trinucleotide repeat-containing gene 18 protein-like [Schistocerca gregaria]